VRVDPLAKESNGNPAYDAGYDISLNRPRGSLDFVTGVVMARHPEEAVLPHASIRECTSRGELATILGDAWSLAHFSAYVSRVSKAAFRAAHPRLTFIPCSRSLRDMDFIASLRRKGIPVTSC